MQFSPQFNISIYKTAKVEGYLSVVEEGSLRKKYVFLSNLLALKYKDRRNKKTQDNQLFFVDLNSFLAPHYETRQNSYSNI